MLRRRSGGRRHGRSDRDRRCGGHASLAWWPRRMQSCEAMSGNAAQSEFSGTVALKTGAALAAPPDSETASIRRVRPPKPAAICRMHPKARHSPINRTKSCKKIAGLWRFYQYMFCEYKLWLISHNNARCEWSNDREACKALASLEPSGPELRAPALRRRGAIDSAWRIARRARLGVRLGRRARLAFRGPRKGKPVGRGMIPGKG